MVDRATWAADTIAAAVEAAEAGLRDKANLIIRHAVHDGLDPTDIVFTALAAEAQAVAGGEWEPTPTVPVIYVGPETGVTLAPAAGGGWMPKGQAVELPEAVARSLCEQPDFVRARRKPRK